MSRTSGSDGASGDIDQSKDQCRGHLSSEQLQEDRTVAGVAGNMDHRTPERNDLENRREKRE